MFMRVASRYVTRGDLYRKNRPAYMAGRRNGWIDQHYGAHTKYLRLSENYDDTARSHD